MNRKANDTATRDLVPPNLTQELEHKHDIARPPFVNKHDNMEGSFPNFLANLRLSFWIRAGIFLPHFHSSISRVRFQSINR